MISVFMIFIKLQIVLKRKQKCVQKEEQLLERHAIHCFLCTILGSEVPKVHRPIKALIGIWSIQFLDQIKQQAY